MSLSFTNFYCRSLASESYKTKSRAGKHVYACFYHLNTRDSCGFAPNQPGKFISIEMAEESNMRSQDPVKPPIIPIEGLPSILNSRLSASNIQPCSCWSIRTISAPTFGQQGNSQLRQLRQQLRCAPPTTPKWAAEVPQLVRSLLGLPNVQPEAGRGSAKPGRWHPNGPIQRGFNGTK